LRTSKRAKVAYTHLATHSSSGTHSAGLLPKKKFNEKPDQDTKSKSNRRMPVIESRLRGCIVIWVTGVSPLK
jgi:hypothetical protein